MFYNSLMVVDFLYLRLFIEFLVTARLQKIVTKFVISQAKLISLATIGIKIFELDSEAAKD